MQINRQWLLASRPQGMVSRENFTYSETPVPEAADGEILLRNLYLSFDPTQRTWMEEEDSYLPPVGIGEVMRAATVAQVVVSRHPGFSAEDVVQTVGGWQDYVVINPEQPFPGVAKIPEGLPPALALGVLGGNGVTAYWGLLDIGRPEDGETVLVSGAAGATGSIVGQIAHIKGCRVIGIAGGQEKCDWLRTAARFDEVIDYKHEDVDKKLHQLCPAGIDVFFDNVGGEILQTALDHLAQHARVVLCGSISEYNATGRRASPNLMNLIFKRAHRRVYRDGLHGPSGNGHPGSGGLDSKWGTGLQGRYARGVREHPGYAGALVYRAEQGQATIAYRDGE